MMTKHTPGPWTIETPFGQETVAIVPAGRPTYEWVIIATCSHDELEYDDGSPRILIRERDANARLIAAAPNLLAALKGVLAGFLLTQKIDDYPQNHPCQLAHAAITEAEGV